MTEKGSLFYVCVMITLTESAATKLKSMREELEDQSQILRVLVDTGGCSGFEYGMAFDNAKPDDTVFESAGIRIAIDPASAVYLEGCSIKFDDGLQGKGFEVINPNAENTCGCGKSFS